MDVSNAIWHATGTQPRTLRRLSGGSIGTVYAVTMADGAQLVAKVDDGLAPTLDVEGAMLRFLAQESALPVPQLIYSAPNLLLMTHCTGRSQFDDSAESHAADLLAALHTITAPHYGFGRPTLIGGLHQPNTPAASWLTFFKEQRLIYMAQSGLDAGRLPPRLHERLLRLADALPRWLSEPAQPALIHGDVWTTNVLALDGRISAFLDPAIYYADPEIELAFITLFDTFGPTFFERYGAIRPIRDGFFEQRRDLYNLYPLLVHVRLFGGGYVTSVERIVRRFGF